MLVLFVVSLLLSLVEAASTAKDELTPAAAAQKAWVEAVIAAIAATDTASQAAEIEEKNIVDKATDSQIRLLKTIVAAAGKEAALATALAGLAQIYAKIAKTAAGQAAEIAQTNTGEAAAFQIQSLIADAAEKETAVAKVLDDLREIYAEINAIAAIQADEIAETKTGEAAASQIQDAAGKVTAVAKALDGQDRIDISILEDNVANVDAAAKTAHFRANKADFVKAIAELDQCYTELDKANVNLDATDQGTAISAIAKENTAENNVKDAACQTAADYAATAHASATEVAQAAQAASDRAEKARTVVLLAGLTATVV